LARCKVYEIQGPDRSRTARAQRCHREATDLAVVGARVVAVCGRHDAKPWELFLGTDHWVYAVNPKAEPAKKVKKGKKRKK
jgi:hypothetical protein